MRRIGAALGTGVTRFFLGPPGQESDKRLVRQLILCVVWVLVSATEVTLTGQSHATRVLTFFWGMCLILWCTILSFGVRVYLDRRRAQRAPAVRPGKRRKA